MKYSQWIGILAAIILVVTCFIPWTWYPDLQKSFTGFYSENNVYGKPGKVFIALAIICSLLFVTPKVWAKRWNLFVCCLLLAYAIKSFILFTGCYRGTCPEKQAGIWMVLVSSAVIMLSALLPPNTAHKNNTPSSEA